MQRLGLASFIIGAGLYLVLASPFRAGRSLYLRERKVATRMAGQHRELPMVGTIIPIFGCEESLPIRGIWATYRACPSRGWNDRSFANLAEYFLGGPSVIGTCLGRH